MTIYRPTADESRILGLLGAMPYGSLVSGKIPYRITHMKPITLDAIADYLEALREVLTVVSEERENEEKELRKNRQGWAGLGLAFRLIRESAIESARRKGRKLDDHKSLKLAFDLIVDHTIESATREREDKDLTRKSQKARRKVRDEDAKKFGGEQ